MNATELFDLLDGLDDSRDAGADGSDVSRSRLVNGIEYALSGAAEERKLRAIWKRRQGGGATPLMLVALGDSGDGLRVLGPVGDGPLRSVRAESLAELVRRTVGMGDLESQRFVAAEIDRLDSERIAGVVVRGLGTEHLFATRLPSSHRWTALDEAAPIEGKREWRDILTELGYELERLPRRGWLARHEDRVIMVVHPKGSASEFARLDEGSRLPEGALLADCEHHGAPYGLMVAGSRLRLLRATGEESGQATRFLELDASLIEPDRRPLLGLLSPVYLAEGEFTALLAEARDYGAKLRLRLDRALRQDVLPILGRELGRWATASNLDIADEEARKELEAASLTFVFRLLFLLYAESAGHLPMANQTYQQRSMTRIAQRAAEEADNADPASTSLWDDIAGLVKAMRRGQRAWGVPAYNGALFAEDGFEGAELLERAAIGDAALGKALVALARDTDEDGNDVGVDFSGLEIGHLGHIYEGLLSLRLTIADRDFDYDERSDRYVPDDEDGKIDVAAGDLFWLTNEGGRKGGGVYYTRTELVRHLVRGSVRPAFRNHVDRIRELAETDPAAAAAKLFDFYVLDPACGSAHFLVEVADEIADQIAELLGDIALPAIRDQLEELRAAAGTSLSVEIDDAALLKRLVLKRCVYGVDLSPMGAEIAKVSLWLATFVPGLSLAYLDHNIQVGNSLIGVARPEAMAPPGEERGTEALFGDPIVDAIRAGATEAAKLRGIADRTPEEVRASAAAAAKLDAAVAGVRRVLDLWTAEPLGLEGAREEVNAKGEGIIGGGGSLLAERAADLARENHAFHWPLEVAEAFARGRPGFDVVVGNPPWDEVDVEELAFYARYKPGLRALGAREREEALVTLKRERPELAERFESERLELAAMRAYLGPGSGYSTGAGDPDLYKFFCQRYRELLRDGGRLGVVLPRSAFVAKGSADFRRWLFEEVAPQRVDFLLNNRNWAFDIHPQYTVALLAAERRKPEMDEPFTVAGVAVSAAEFEAQAESPGLRVARAALGPEREVPLLPSQAHADLLAKLRGTDSPFPLGSGRWACFATEGDLHETNDKRLWQGAESGRPLWKGESFEQFDPHGREARVCPVTEDVLKRARKSRPGASSMLADEVSLAERRGAVRRTLDQARIAYRRVTNRTNSRTVLACLVPPMHLLTNAAPYLSFVKGDATSTAACLALMNSLAFDWQVRRFVEMNLNIFILEGLRLPTLDDESFVALAGAAARLSSPDDRFADFAAATGVECGHLSEDERIGLRVEIDAQVARAWDLNADELELVFSDFTLDAVPEAYREAVRQRFSELK
ncbi:MAG: hypothetical protein U0R51_08270 [Solirubrobacterales bacterium]